MLPRIYLLAGSLLVVSYALSEMAGWEYGNPIRVTPAPPVGADVTASRAGFGGGRSAIYSHGYSSTYRGSPTVTGPTGGK